MKSKTSEKRVFLATFTPCSLSLGSQKSDMCIFILILSNKNEFNNKQCVSKLEEFNKIKKTGLNTTQPSKNASKHYTNYTFPITVAVV